MKFGPDCRAGATSTPPPKGQQAIRDLFRVGRDLTGNLPPLPGIFPDYMAPIVRTSRDGERVLEMMRWGFPPPPNQSNYPVTNVGGDGESKPG
ncbi:MAG: putative response-associated peptidase [Microvirga sp.]|jgi:putative SOS response-associated peptidase YedK|nr:putative response-associated peptidase [Microvirga sp.]